MDDRISCANSVDPILASASALACSNPGSRSPSSQYFRPSTAASNAFNASPDLFAFLLASRYNAIFCSSTFLPGLQTIQLDQTVHVGVRAKQLRSTIGETVANLVFL